MSLINSTIFNTNPACVGVGPTEPVRDPYKTTQLVIFTIISVFTIATTLFFLWRRANRRRLRHRSLVPIVFGSIFGTVFMMIRVYYNYVGKQYFTCTFSTVIYYLVIPVTIVADSLAFIRYLHSLSARQDVSGDTLKAVAQDKKTTTDHLGKASLKTWLIGLHNYLLFLVGLYFPCYDVARLHIKEEKFRSVSKSRMTSYETITVCILLLPFVIACITRSRTTPELMIENGCTGCGVLLVDWIIVFIAFAIYLVPLGNFVYHHSEVPDGLMFKKDAKIGAIFLTTFVFPGSILALVDPGQVMKSQQFDWFTFDILGVFFFHWIRVVLQLWRTARIHKYAEQHITLIQVLSDGKGSLLFEKHLMSELANENLLFWREAIKYKLAYDKQPDFEYTQQMARVLFRTFIGRHAQLPINISDNLARSIEQRFKGTVSRAVFDDAIIEVYRLLEGPFRRFVHSEAFKEYAKTKADFSMSVILNPKAIVPHDGKEDPEDANRFVIEEYVHTL